MLKLFSLSVSRIGLIFIRRSNNMICKENINNKILYQPLSILRMLPMHTECKTWLKLSKCLVLTIYCKRRCLHKLPNTLPYLKLPPDRYLLCWTHTTIRTRITAHNRTRWTISTWLPWQQIKATTSYTRCAILTVQTSWLHPHILREHSTTWDHCADCVTLRPQLQRLTDPASLY